MSLNINRRCVDRFTAAYSSMCCGRPVYDFFKNIKGARDEKGSFVDRSLAAHSGTSVQVRTRNKNQRAKKLKKLLKFICNKNILFL